MNYTVICKHAVIMAFDPNSTLEYVTLENDITVDDQSDTLTMSDCQDENGDILMKYWNWPIPLYVSYMDIDENDDDNPGIIVSHHSKSVIERTPHVHMSFLKECVGPYITHGNIYPVMTDIVEIKVVQNCTVLDIPELFTESYSELSPDVSNDELVSHMGLEGKVDVILNRGDVAILRPSLSTVKLYIGIDKSFSALAFDGMIDCDTHFDDLDITENTSNKGNSQHSPTAKYVLTTKPTDIPIVLTFDTLSYRTSSSVADLLQQLLPLRYVTAIKQIYKYSDISII